MRRQQHERAVHPHRLSRHVRIECDRTVRGRCRRCGVARRRPDRPLANLLESTALSQQRERCCDEVERQAVEHGVHADGAKLRCAAHCTRGAEARAA
eukprot:6199907-Prymnesium_polylepis.1